MSKTHQIIHFLRHRLTALHGGHGVHSPFVYQLCEEVFYNSAHLYRFDYLTALREALKEDKTVISMEDLGAGSLKFTSSQRTIGSIIQHGISTAPQAEMLAKLLNFMKLDNCIELGTSIGLTSLYLASTGATVHTIEGCRDLYAYAKQLGEKASVKNIVYHFGNFDKVMPPLLTEIKQPALFYIDGNHTYEATLRYVNWCLTAVQEDSIIALDDIYWNAEMTRAWEKVRQMEQVSISLDLFHTGLLFFKKAPREKIHYKIRL
jgi:predicted O-methyltransferase YrrM